MVSMFRSMTVINDRNESLTISLADPRESGYLISGIDGLGPTKATLWHSESVTSDGSVFNGARKESRDITITLAYLWDANHSIEELRHRIYRYFPEKRAVTLIFETDTRRVKTVGHVENNDVAIFTSQEASAITIRCADPWFEDASEVSEIVTQFSTVESRFEFPFPIAGDTFEFGNIGIDHSKIVQYDGEAEVGVIITVELTGPVSNPSFYNEDWDESILIYTDKVKSIIGSDLQSGDQIIISTVPGEKYARIRREGIDYNVLNAIDRAVSWITLYPGNNVITYMAESGIDNMMVSVSSKILYAGV